MSNGDVGAQEYIPKDEDNDHQACSAGKQNLSKVDDKSNIIKRIKVTLSESLYGLRTQKLKIAEQNEIFVALRRAQEELTALEKTPQRLEREDKIATDEYEARKIRQTLDKLRLSREIQEEQNAKDLLELQHAFKKVELELQIAELKNKMARLDGSAHDTPSSADPHIEQARDGIRRYMERNRNLGADKKKWFAQIDADLARGELSEEMAENMKEDIEQIIRDSLLKP